MRKTLHLLVFLFCACAFTAHAEISPEKRTEIEKMMRLTGMERLATQMMDQMMSTFKTQIPDVPGDFWTKFSQKADVHELIELIIPIYDKYYTLDDLKAVNAFYESPAGKKIMATLPQVMKESTKVGQAWGAKIAREVQADAAAAKKP